MRHTGGGAGGAPPSPRGNLLYAEFQRGSDGNVDFANASHFELFDLDADPWQARRGGVNRRGEQTV